MSLETVVHIADLVVTNPTASDLQVAPSLAANNAVTLLAANPVERPELHKRNAASSVALSNREDVGFCEFDHAMRLASLLRESVARVKNICAVTDPLKVIYAVICWVEINVVHLCAIWPVAKKGLSHKPVNKGANLRAITTKLHAAMAVFPSFRGKNDIRHIPSSADSEAHNTPKIGDAVKRFVAGDWLPNFDHFQPLSVDCSVGVAWQLAQKPAFGSYPSQAGAY